MKKVLSLFLVASLIIGLGSCTKEAPNQAGQNPFYVPGGGGNPGGGTGGGGTDPEPTPTNPMGDLPADFTKKVLIEEATGEWCGFCPDGAAKLEAIITANPNTAIGVAVHQGDAFEVADYWSHFDALVDVSGFPSGSVERTKATGRTAWAGQFATESQKAADCAIGMVSEVNGTDLNLDVYVGYKAPITTATKITIMVIENGVPETSPDAQSGAPSGYIHEHLLRGVVTAVGGDDIALNEATNYTKLSISNFDLSKLATKIDDMNKAHLVVFVHSADGKTVLNTQECSINDEKQWE